MTEIADLTPVVGEVKILQPELFVQLCLLFLSLSLSFFKTIIVFIHSIHQTIYLFFSPSASLFSSGEVLGFFYSDCIHLGFLTKMEMGNRWFVVLSMVMAVACVCMVSADSNKEIIVKKVNGKTVCEQGWECKGPSAYCCNQTISDLFQTYQFEDLFSKRNSPVAHAVGFWDYKSFLTASAVYQPLGFGTTGGKLMQMKEIAAFFGHVGAKTSCGYGVATGGPLAWGLCYNKEMSPSQDYCDDYFKYEYPCSPGAQYYGRGAIPVYWNYNYGKIGKNLKIDLLNHPEYLEQNATVAFLAAMSQWMTPVRKGQPSAHDCFVGNWKPTKNDTMEKRVPGFGTTMNILYGDQICGQGDIDPMNVCVSHYQHYLDLVGVGREEAGPHEVLTCAEQVAFNPSNSKSSS